MDTSSREAIVSSFRDKQPLYADLLARVKSLITTLISNAGIRVDSIQDRTKSVDSLRDKLNRKSYEGLQDVPDLAALRVIRYHREDAERVVELIQNEFDVDDGESEDIAARLAPNEFD